MPTLKVAHTDARVLSARTQEMDYSPKALVYTIADSSWQFEDVIIPKSWHESSPSPVGSFSNMTSMEFVDAYNKLYKARPTNVAADMFAGAAEAGLAILAVAVSLHNLLSRLAWLPLLSSALCSVSWPGWLGRRSGIVELSRPKAKESKHATS